MRAVPLLPLLALLVLPTVAAADEATQGCITPAALTAAAPPLPSLRAALGAAGPIEILAVGSASTAGPETGNPGRSYIARLEAALRTALPGRTLRLTVRGARGMTAATMATLLETELASHRYRLVLWQTGTVEAVQGLSPETLRDALETGLARARAAGASLVLIDPQFTPTLRDRTAVALYRDIMTQAAAQPDVALFPRFDLTEGWAVTQKLDLEHVARTDRETALENLSACIGDALARFVLTAGGK